jgi:cytochrome b involved in lipid metabolism
MESFFYTIAGLPIHPLVVHFAVVILPLASLSVIVAIYLPKYADKFAFVSLIFVIVGTFFAFVASQSGGALAEKIGLPQNHANYGDLLPNVAGAFSLLCLAWYLIRVGKIRKRVKFLNHLTASLGVAVIGLTFITGHTGAQAVWENKIKSIEGLDTTNTQTNKPSSKNLDNSDAQNQNLINLTRAEVKLHATAADCWSVINGKVYNLTSFVQNHPGGVGAISALCGKDGSSAFKNQHGQSSKPNNILNGLLLGSLGSTIKK